MRWSYWPPDARSPAPAGRIEPPRPQVDSPTGTLGGGIDGKPAVLNTPLRFQIHPCALRMLLPPPRTKQHGDWLQPRYPDGPCGACST